MVETPTEQPLPRQGRATIALRHMRVETDFRRETHRLERRERDKYSSLLLNLIRMEGKPKVAILDMVGPRLENRLEYGHEEGLKQSVDFYYGRIDRTDLTRVLKYFTVYLMQQARKEEDPEKQLFLIFKAVEFARMIVQYSPFSINADAETLVFGVFNDLGEQRPAQFLRYVEYEQEIFRIIKRLHFSPVDNDTRMLLAEQYNLQTSYYDAMVQYQFLLTRFPRIPKEADIPRGRICIKIAEIFQQLADYAGGGGQEFRDARKLRNFIDRYNRDFAPRKRRLPRIQKPTASEIGRAAQAMLREANVWYHRALVVRVMGPRMVTRLATQIAQNQLTDRQPKEALKTLKSGYSHWRRVPEAVETIELRLEYLATMATLAQQLKQKDTLNFASQEAREFQNRLTEHEVRRKAEEERKAAIIEGAEEFLA